MHKVQQLLTAIFCLAFFFCTSPLVYANTYGSGTYGGGTYNNGASSTSNSNNSSNNGGNSPPSCTLIPPPDPAPFIYALVPGNGAVTLYFTDSSTPYDHYTIAYGYAAGNYQFGANNVAKGTRIFTIGSLGYFTTYHVHIRAANGCAVGNWSNDISAKTLGAFSTNTLQITNTTSTATSTTVVLTPTVTPNLLPTHTKPQTLLPLHAATPSISPTVVETTPTTNEKTTGYDVTILAKDTTNKPIAGATITLHSTPVTATTDSQGAVTFHNVPAGEHSIIISYNNYQGSENISVAGNVKQIAITVKVAPTGLTLSPVIIGESVAGGLVLGIMFVFVFLRFRKKKEKNLSETT